MENPLGAYGLQECHISNLQFFQGIINFYASYASLLTFTSDGERTSELFIPYQELLYFKVVKSQHVIHIALPNDYILQWVAINEPIVKASGAEALQDLSSETGIEDCRYPMAMRFADGSAMEHFIQHMVPHLKRDRESRSFSRMSISTLIPSRNSFSYPGDEQDKTRHEQGKRVGAGSTAGSEGVDDRFSQDSFCTNNSDSSPISNPERSFSEEEEEQTVGGGEGEASLNRNKAESLSKPFSPRGLPLSAEGTLSCRPPSEVSPEEHSRARTSNPPLTSPCSRPLSFPFHDSEEQTNNTRTRVGGAAVSKQADRTLANKNLEEEMLLPAMPHSELTEECCKHITREERRQPNFSRCATTLVNIESQLEALQLPGSPVRLLPRRRQGGYERGGSLAVPPAAKGVLHLPSPPRSPGVLSNETLRSVASSHPERVTFKRVKGKQKGRPPAVEGVEKGSEIERKRPRNETTTGGRGKRKVHLAEVISSNPSALNSHVLTPVVSAIPPLPVQEAEVQLPMSRLKVIQHVKESEEGDGAVPSFPQGNTVSPVPPASAPSMHPFSGASAISSRGGMEREGRNGGKNRLDALPCTPPHEFAFNDVETLPRRDATNTKKLAGSTIAAGSSSSPHSSIHSARNPSAKWAEQTTKLNSFLLSLMGCTKKTKKKAPKIQKNKKGPLTASGRASVPTSNVVARSNNHDTLAHTLLPTTLSSTCAVPAPFDTRREEAPSQMNVESKRKLTYASISEPSEQSSPPLVEKRGGESSELRPQMCANVATLPSMEDECAATPGVGLSVSSFGGNAAEWCHSECLPDDEGKTKDPVLLNAVNSPASTTVSPEKPMRRFSSEKVSRIPAKFGCSSDSKELKHQRLQQAMLSLNRISYYLQVMRESEEEVRGLLLVLGSNEKDI